jgi:hypothetical protein
MRLLLLVLATAAIMLTTSCGLCSNQLVRAARSPDGIVEATWYVRNCGATTDFSTMVSVHQPNGSYTDESDLVFVAKGKYNLKLSWAGPRELTIDCEGCSRKNVFRETTRLGDIDVMFPAQ